MCNWSELISGPEFNALISQITPDGCEIKSITLDTPDIGYTVSGTRSKIVEITKDVGEPMYAWIDGNDTLRLYAPAEVRWIYLNPDSSYMFADMPELTNIYPLHCFSARDLQDATCMFKGCRSLANIEDIGYWNANKLTDINRMFLGCEKLESLALLKSWKPRGLRDVSGAFASSGIRSADGLENFGIRKADYVRAAFSGCENLENVDALKGWNLGSKDALGMFANCGRLSDEALKGIGIADTGKAREFFDPWSNAGDEYRDSKNAAKAKWQAETKKRHSGRSM